MEFIIPFGVFLLGLAAGSFLNVVVIRLGSEESILWGRSHCMTCEHSLEWSELIPVLSFIMLGGTCRACHQPISFRYPLVEVLTGIVFLFVYISYNKNLFLGWSSGIAGNELMWYLGGLVFYFSLAFLLLAIGLYDLRTYLIAPSLTAPLFLLAVIGIVTQWTRGALIEDIRPTVVAAVIVFIAFAGIWFFSKGKAMGFGDAELASAIMLFLGPPLGTAALMISFWAGALVGCMLLATGKAGLKSKIAFGPFLVLGALCSLFWGSALLHIYFSMTIG